MGHLTRPSTEPRLRLAPSGERIAPITNAQTAESKRDPHWWLVRDDRRLLAWVDRLGPDAPVGDVRRRWWNAAKGLGQSDRFYASVDRALCARLIEEDGGFYRLTPRGRRRLERMENQDG